MLRVHPAAVEQRWVEQQIVLRAQRLVAHEALVAAGDGVVASTILVEAGDQDHVRQGETYLAVAGVFAVRLRRIPRLSFYLDESMKKQAELEARLAEPSQEELTS